MNSASPSEFESKGLQTELDPPARCATCLFKLLTRIAGDARLIGGANREPAGQRLRLWANGPGHNAIETFTLALLALWLSGGLAAAWIVEAGKGHALAWLAAVVLAPLVAFVSLHLVAFGAALGGMGIQALGVAAGQPHRSVTLFLSLLILTALAIDALLSGCPLRIAAAAPWLLWGLLEVIAAAVLLTGSLAAALRSLDASPADHRSDA